MKCAIWKYALQGESVQPVMMPKGARILSVEEQDDRIVVYALVHTEAEPEERTVHILGTGHSADSLPDSAQFVGTVKMYSGRLMFHVFAS